MGDALRAQIVAALRAEADRIEAGAEPICWASDGEGYVCDGRGYAAAECRQYAEDVVTECREAAAADEWPEEMNCVAWGVRVTVEAACLVARRRATYPGRVGEIWDYALVDPRTHVEPELGDPACASCDKERPCTLTDDGYWCAECLAAEETPCTKS